MKVLLVTFVLVAAAVAALVYFGGFTSFDPAAQAQEFKQTVKPGMSWKEVADLRKPKTIVQYDIDSQGLSVERQVGYDMDEFARRMDKGQFDQGFAFQYVFTADDAVSVSFDEQGNVQSMDKMRTTNDLLQGNLYGQ